MMKWEQKMHKYCPMYRSFMKDDNECLGAKNVVYALSVHKFGFKGADLFQKGGQTKKQTAGRGTSRYSIGIKSWPELISN